MTRTPIALVAGGLVACAALVAAHSPSAGQAPTEGPPQAKPATPEPDTAAALQARFAEAGEPVPDLGVQGKEGALTVFRFDVDATKAVPEWLRLRAIVDVTGYYPVICSDQEETLVEQRSLNETTAEATLFKAKHADGLAWLKKRAADDPEYYGALTIGTPEDPAELLRHKDKTDAEIVDGWSGMEREFAPMTYDSKPIEGTWIALVPTKHSYEVPAFFRLGGWNGCPPAWVHVTVLREWHKRYGTEIVALTGDTVKLRSPRPPKTLKAATQFAHEQFLYSGGDSVFPGNGTLMELIELVIGYPYSFVWWD